MSLNLPAPRSWNRVSKRTPCPICNKPDWCTLGVDGSVAACMRVVSSRRLKNGGWLHYLNGNTVTQLPPVTLTKPAACLAPLMQRDLVYRAFLAELGLRPHHKEHLERVRGLPSGPTSDFASTPPSTHAERRKLVGRVIERLGRSDLLRGVPGFLVDKYGNWTCQWVPPGIMIPVREPLFALQALQVRLDSCGPGTGRYRWFSSRGKPGGSSPGVPAAFWWPPRLDYEPVLLTEGALKARIASWHLQAKAIGVPGVSTWRRALPMILPGQAVIIAYDADARTNPVVARHQLELARSLFWAGHQVAIATWDPQFKGIDDAVLAGAAIELKAWPSEPQPLPPLINHLRDSLEAPREVSQ